LQRRLAAILSADAAGYSRLMGDDEVATVQTLNNCRALVSQTIVANNGRVVDSPGDNLLAEFGSAVDAVSAACEIQDKLGKCNAELPEHRRMAFRIGVNLGEVLAEDGRIYGDGVNIAARLEALAEVGGICVSGKVRDEVGRRIAVEFDDMGEHQLHNIAAPVHAWGVRRANAAAPAAPAPAKAAAESIKPSIIVLPFVNMSGDAEQEFFADGLTEDILTELSRFRELFVISRNTAFKFKGQAVDVKRVARDAGVQYVLEGSVRRAGQRVRITAQLIDAVADRHLWAERYDRELADIFAVQDEMTRAIVAVLPGRLEAAARERAARKLPQNMAAYECVISAKLLHHRSNRSDNDQAQRLIARAIELDPSYAHAHAWRACILGQAWGYNWCADPQAQEREIDRELEVALGLDDNDSDVHRILAALSVVRNDLDQAAFHQERALALNPNDDLIVVQQGELLTWQGRPEEGIEWIRRAMRLNPFHPDRFWGHLARAQFTASRDADAVVSMGHVTAPTALQHALLAACHARLGHAAAAAQHRGEAVRLQSDIDISHHLKPALHYQHAADTERVVDALRQAGFED
jgi:adenylate cyclase